MFSAPQSITAGSTTTPQQGTRGLRRTVLLLACGTFWLNTFLFTCCDAIGAALDGRSDTVSQLVSDTRPAQDLARTRPDRSDQSLDLKCGYNVSALPESVDVAAALRSEFSSPEWFAIDARVAPTLITVSHAENLAPRGNPPPPLRLYLRTLRLLI